MTAQSCSSCIHWAPYVEEAEEGPGLCHRPSRQQYMSRVWPITTGPDHCEEWKTADARESDVALNQVDRRQRVRLSIDVEAQLKLPSGERTVRITDISESGARLQLLDPPPVGAIGPLIWRSYEVFAKVVWANGAACEMEFERPIARSVVEATAEGGEVQSLSIAEVTNIPLGRKRSRHSSTSGQASSTAA
jgi:hypothetical protein